MVSSFEETKLITRVLKAVRQSPPTLPDPRRGAWTRAAVATARPTDRPDPDPRSPAVMFLFNPKVTFLELDGALCGCRKKWQGKE